MKKMCKCGCWAIGKKTLCPGCGSEMTDVCHCLVVKNEFDNKDDIFQEKPFEVTTRIMLRNGEMVLEGITL